jgi:hypothetical protein
MTDASTRAHRCSCLGLGAHDTTHQPQGRGFAKCKRGARRHDSGEFGPATRRQLNASTLAHRCALARCLETGLRDAVSQSATSGNDPVKWRVRVITHTRFKGGHTAGPTKQVDARARPLIRDGTSQASNPPASRARKRIAPSFVPPSTLCCCVWFVVVALLLRLPCAPCLTQGHQFSLTGRIASHSLAFLVVAARRFAAFAVLAGAPSQ